MRTMIDKTWDAEDPRELPYRFAYSLITDEIFIITIMQGFNVVSYFENRFAFHRFLVEGNETDDLIQEGTLREALDILRNKQGGV